MTISSPVGMTFDFALAPIWNNSDCSHKQDLNGKQLEKAIVASLPAKRHSTYADNTLCR
ncbi:hypothetical protein PC120_g24517 [Phytophthora cactorum]|nr:hypothetical protein PC120_g24517 [Phytophthora cactorum]